jgi:hypothetical protein
MTTDATPTLLECFASLPDPRMRRTQCHKLLDIVAMAMLGMICRADNITAQIIKQQGDDVLAVKENQEAPRAPPRHLCGRCACRLCPDRRP